MSRWSGKCDFADHISGLGGWYDKDGNPVKFGQEGIGAYYSDELQDFREFKRKTGGVMYQHKRINKIDEWNQDFVASKCSNFKIIKHVNRVDDKRKKEGYREVVSYTYEYWGKEYTQKEINKKGVYITTEIHFDTLLDIIKYYPYLVSSCCSNGDKMIVYLSDRSFVDEEYDDMLQYGHESMKQYYDKKLAEHYLEVAREYYLKDINKRTSLICLSDQADHEDDTYVYYKTSSKIDDLHKVEWYFVDGEKIAHWDDPQIVDDHTVKFDKVNLRYFDEAIKKQKVWIKYVAAIEPSIVLR